MISIVPGIILPQRHLAFLMPGFYYCFQQEGDCFFLQAGKMFLTEPCYKKNVPLSNQSRLKENSFSQPVNLPDLWSLIKPLL